MNNHTHPSVLNKVTDERIFISRLLNSFQLQNEVRKLGKLTNLICGCDANCGNKMNLSGGIGKKIGCYFKANPNQKNCNASRETEKHLKWKQFIQKYWGALLPDEDNSIWPDAPRPDGVMENEKIVIEIESYSSSRRWETIVDRNQYYREQGYTPFWIIIGKSWGKIKSTKLSNLNSFEQGIFADCGVLHYYVDDDKNCEEFLTYLQFKRDNRCILHHPKHQLYSQEKGLHLVGIFDTDLFVMEKPIVKPAHRYKSHIWCDVEIENQVIKWGVFNDCL